jgi:hypothetical protein
MVVSAEHGIAGTGLCLCVRGRFLKLGVDFVHSLVYFFFIFLQLIWEGVGMAMTCGAASWVEAVREQGGLLQASCVVFLPSL